MKTAIVTGGGRGIGLGITKALAEAGFQIAVVGSSEEARYAQALSQLREAGHSIVYFQHDLADTAGSRVCVERIAENLGRIDVLVNNAGIVKDSLFASMSYEDFTQVIETNMFSIFRLTKDALMLLRAAENPAIINVASIAALIPSVGQANYSASKGAILGFTRTLAAEMAPWGVRVNAVAPGMIESKMVKKVSRAVVRAVTSTIPLRRLGKCEEVANTIVFLSSSASSYIVGQTIVIDGGLVMR